ncbi:hypothetical protein N9K77_00245 [bacterium]|nr:hypothetical protein [bacterium]
MKSKTILFRDPVVERVCDKFVKRSDVGYAKYGRTLHDERTGKHKDLAGYLNDIQEELMDAILYIQAAREELVESKPQPEAFRPPHPSHADEFYHLADNKLVGGMTGDTEKGLVNAQKDWDDKISPV